MPSGVGLLSYIPTWSYILTCQMTLESSMVPSMDLLGFWSYVHTDDEVDMGRATQLAKDIAANYEATKGERIELFLDRDDLHWGDAWLDRVDEALSNVAFFIPVITPLYFTRLECRRELQFFVNKAEKLGVTEIILPILYRDVPALHEADPTDPLMKTIKQIQWRSWTELRLKDRFSSEYRTAVDELAVELVRRVMVVESKDVVSAVESADDSAEEGEAGTLDKIAALEEAMPRWTESLSAISEEIDRIGKIMSQGTVDIERGTKSGKGTAARLTVARRVAQELGGPVENIEVLGQTFATSLAEIDEGVRTLLIEGAAQLQESNDPAELAQYCEFVGTIRGLVIASREGLGSVKQMVASSQPLEKMSKDMRMPLRRLRSSLTAMAQAQEITDAWGVVVDESSIDCQGSAKQS